MWQIAEKSRRSPGNSRRVASYVVTERSQGGSVEILTEALAPSANPFAAETVTHASGMKCYLCLRNRPAKAGCVGRVSELVGRWGGRLTGDDSRD